MIFFSSSSKFEITYKLKLNAEKELLSYTSPPLRYSKLMWLLVTWNPPRKYVVRRHTHRGNYIFHVVCHGFPFPHRVYNVDMLHSEEKSHHTSTTVLLTSSLPPSLFFSHQAVDTINFLPWIKVQSLASENGSFRHGVSVSRQNASLVSSGSRYFFSALFSPPLI